MSLARLALVVVQAVAQEVDDTIGKLLAQPTKPSAEQEVQAYQAREKNKGEVEGEELIRENQEHLGIEDLNYSRPETRSALLSKTDQLYWDATGKIEALIRKAMEK